MRDGRYECGKGMNAGHVPYNAGTVGNSAMSIARTPKHDIVIRLGLAHTKNKYNRMTLTHTEAPILSL